MDIKAVCITYKCPHCIWSNLNYMVKAMCTKSDSWTNDITRVPKDCPYKKEIREYKQRMKKKNGKEKFQ